jgi:hypothetical protein
MAVLVSVPLQDGGHIVVEASEEKVQGGVVRAARPDAAVKQSGATLEDALQTTLVPLARAFMDRISELRPQEAEISMGLKLSAEAGLVVSKIAGEASFGVKLVWRSQEVQHEA